MSPFSAVLSSVYVFDIFRERLDIPCGRPIGAWLVLDLLDFEEIRDLAEHGGDFLVLHPELILLALTIAVVG